MRNLRRMSRVLLVEVSKELSLVMIVGYSSPEV